MTIYNKLSDISTRILNAQKSRKLEEKLNNTKATRNILKVLQREGFIRGFIIKDRLIYVQLKYFMDKPTLKKIKPILYKNENIRVVDLKKLRSKNINFDKNRGLDTFILSTSKGLMSDKEAISKNIGGKLLLKVF